MSDIEIPSDVLAGAVVAHAVGQSLEGGERHSTGHGTCANCGAELTGRFCQQCGQSAHVHRSLLHMVEELLHGIFHFETKAWRTIPLLLFRPGRLTREYIDGKRVRYVGPLPLFLFMMFLMFLVLSLTGSSDHKKEDAEPKVVDIGKDGNVQVKEATGEIKRLKAEMAALAASDPQRSADAKKIESLESKLAALTWVPGIMNGEDDDKSDQTPLSEESVHKELAKNLPALAKPSFERKVAHAWNNKELARYKMKNGAAKYAILLVPITLPFLWLLFIFRRQYKMFDHAVFSFYSLSAMSVWVTIVALLTVADFDGTAAMITCFAPPIHLFVQFRGTYALTVWGSLWRTFAMLIYASLALVAYFLIVVVAST